MMIADHMREFGWRQSAYDYLPGLNYVFMIHEDTGKTLMLMNLVHHGTSAVTPKQIETIHSILTRRIKPHYRIIYSTTPNVFSSGGDLAMFADNLGTDRLAGYARLCDQVTQMITFDEDTINIGILDGAAYGGGYEMLLACQHVLFTRSSALCLPEVIYGMFPGMGGLVWGGVSAAIRLLAGDGQPDMPTDGGRFVPYFPIHGRTPIGPVRPESLVQAALDDVQQIDKDLPGFYQNLAIQRRFAGVTPDAIGQSVKMWLNRTNRLVARDIRRLRAGARAQRSMLGSCERSPVSLTD